MDHQTLIENHWKDRTNLEKQLDTVNHPHRKDVMVVLEKLMPFNSILEVGCGAGANLVNIKKELPDVHICGFDINNKAIEKCRTAVPEAYLATDTLANFNCKAKSFDVVLSDAVLMYITPNLIKIILLKLTQMAKKAIVLFELEGEKETTDGENYYRNYKEILEELGLEVVRYKLKSWKVEPWKSYGYMYIARLPSPTSKTNS